MRIREILFHDFRSFRGKRQISFVDPLTDAVQPMTIIAGTNGTGKTTILDAIEALLAYVLEPENPRDLIIEAWETGLVCLALELTPSDLLQSTKQQSLFGETTEILHIAVGRRDLAPKRPQSEWPNLFCRLVQRGVSGRDFVRQKPQQSPLAEKLRKAVSQMHQGKAELCGGFLYFPHDRSLGHTQSGPIQPPPEERQWVFRFSATDRWQGSLEQLWVWQNYLDLERGAQGRDNLKPFVATVEDILGEERRIIVSSGRVLATASWGAHSGEAPTVQLDRLPSGEQQSLLLFGELARRRRHEAVIAIDEPEISLHPTLQRSVVHRLRKFAREWNAQLLLATHSLEVLREAHESERIVLDRLDETGLV
jgi:energy-coupling factor transporter ATP-binding protein EcfA2